MLKSKECRLQIGEFYCSLQFEEEEWATAVRKYYEGFLSDKDPDLSIDLKIIPHQQQIEIPSSLILERTVEGNEFDFHSGLLKGTLDLKSKKVTIEVKQGLLKNIRVFDQFLYHTYYTLLKERYPSNGANHFLVHASGVAMDGEAYVFVGPSGSGKTTMANLTPEGFILNDEIVIIGKKNGHFQATSTPFGQRLANGKDLSAPIKSLFLLRHGDQNCIKELTPVAFARFLFKEIVVPLSLHSKDKGKALMEMIDFCGRIVSETPCYELHFLPDESVWACINENVRKSIFHSN